MVRLELRSDQGRMLPMWTNFRLHVDAKHDAQHTTESIIMNNRLWMTVRDQELKLWKATLVTEHDPQGFRSFYLEFPSQEDLIAFQITWS